MMKRYSISLKFLHGKGDRVELQSFEFIDRATGFRSFALRGGSQLPKGVIGFGLTNGVRALCILIVKSAGFMHHPETFNPQLSGEKASFVSTLDYAISKNPVWLTEFFGADNEGISNFRNFVRRNNPELKRPGPVSIFFRNIFLERTDFHILIDDRNVLNAHDLERIICDLEFDQSNVREGAVSGSELTPVGSFGSIVMLDNRTNVEILNDQGDARVSCSFQLLNTSQDHLSSHTHPIWFDESCGEFEFYALNGLKPHRHFELHRIDTHSYSSVLPFQKKLFHGETISYGYTYLCERMFLQDLSWQFRATAITEHLRIQIIDRRRRNCVDAHLAIRDLTGDTPRNTVIASRSNSLRGLKFEAQRHSFGTEISWAFRKVPFNKCFETRWQLQALTTSSELGD